MNNLHKGINFENEICNYMAANSWFYVEGDSTNYDRARALFPADVVDWIQSTQTEAWDALTENHGVQATFSNSPDLANEIMNAIMDALVAHTSMSKQALESEQVRNGFRDILLGPAQLYEALNDQELKRSSLPDAITNGKEAHPLLPVF